jgi:UDP-arabinose 4-epimerase
LRVLVTGGAGYIGSHACKALAAAGHTPIAFDNLRTGHRWAVRWGPFEHGDVTDPARIAEALRAHRPEAVMHFAALAYVGESVQRPDLYYRVNVGGTLSLIEAMRATDVGRMVFSSSCATYGEPATTPICESAAQQPVNPYGWSKLMSEQVLRDASQAFGLSVTALRYFNAAGADPDGEVGEEHEPETHLLPLVLQAAAGRRTHIDIFGDDYPTPDGACVRDYIHVSDLAAAHVAALERSDGFAAFNLGVGRGASVKQVIEAARKVTGKAIPARVAARRPGDPPVLVADARLAGESLAWAPVLPDLETMIETAWRWMRDHRDKAMAAAA